MSLYLSKAAVITENDPPVVTAPVTRSVTVIVRSGRAHVSLGQYSQGEVILKAGETVSWSTLGSTDAVEQMTVSALDAGAETLVIWTYF